MPKTLAIDVVNGEPRVVLDKVAVNRLDAAIGVCAQVMMGEQTTEMANEARTAIRAMQNLVRGTVERDDATL